QITGILFIFIGMTLTLKKSKDKKLSQKEKRIESDASISQQ
ncbi:EamA family transporter, partial [Bacillus thuringiensis]|nr:EamA family transporter [Bacillus thuringiensis]